MKLAISPCPNDTFIFWGWIEGHVGEKLPIVPTFADIEQLNQWARARAFPLIKISVACLANVASHFQLLPVGAALGFNCGPKLIAKNFFSLAELNHKTIAIPGEHTTAHLLFRHFFPTQSKKLFCRYDEIAHLLEKGMVDAGLVIHESRFTFQKAGFMELADLGEMWESQNHLPLPLGAIAVARSLPLETKADLARTIQASLHCAQRYPEKALPFILKYAKEKQIEIVERHIATYVNRESESLSNKGKEAIMKLVGKPLPHDWLVPL